MAYPIPRASEYEATKAVAEIKKAIDAAENSNQAGEDIVALMARAPALYQHNVELEDALDRCLEFLDDQVDTVDGDEGQPEPNKAMRLVSYIREVYPEAGAKAKRPTEDERVARMADRFLFWKLPANFMPDGGITFQPLMNEGTRYELKNEPRGTNLFDATQAEAMVRHMLELSPLSTQPTTST